MKVNIFVVLVLMAIADAAPKRSYKGTGPHTVYDQQQSGDYNIQVHLKDFQIIALLGDDNAGLGDYDYTYDYSDFTIKPSSQKPTEPTPQSSPISTAQPPSDVSTSRSPHHPYPFITTSTTNLTKPEEHTSSTGNPVANSSENAISTDKPNIEGETATNPANFLDTNATITVTSKKDLKLDDSNSAGKIKVQIIETPIRMNAVPGEEVDQNETSPQGEILQLKRCASGFTRDKRGRCRRVRRPGNVQSQIPYGFGRLASSLASRFRQSDQSLSPPSDPKEN